MDDSINQSPNSHHNANNRPVWNATWRVVMGAVGAVACIQCVSFGLIYCFIGDWAKRGQFGDLFGATNSFFSGLAFAGLVYTIYLQGRQISLQSLDSHRSDVDAKSTLRLAADSVRLANDELELARKRERLDLNVILLNHYQNELAHIRKLESQGLASGNVYRQESSLVTKISNLKKMIDDTYEKSLI